MRAAGSTGPSHLEGAGKFREPVRDTLGNKVSRAGVGRVTSWLTVKARIWLASHCGSDRRFLPEEIQAALRSLPLGYLSNLREGAQGNWAHRKAS